MQIGGSAALDRGLAVLTASLALDAMALIRMRSTEAGSVRKLISCVVR